MKKHPGINCRELPWDGVIDERDGRIDGCREGGGEERKEEEEGNKYMNATDGSLKFSVNCSSKQTKQQDICLPAGVSVFLGSSLS